MNAPTQTGIFDQIGLDLSEKSVVYITIVLSSWFLVMFILGTALRLVVKRKYPRTLATSTKTQAFMEDSDVPGEETFKKGLFFCYNDAAWKYPGETEDADDITARTSVNISLTKRCEKCSQYIVPHDWMTQLIEFFTRYHDNEFSEINKRFPLDHFVTWSERVFLIVGVCSALSNVAFIIHKVSTVPERNKEEEYNFTLISLAWAEFCCIWIALAWKMYQASRILRINKSTIKGRTFVRFLVAFVPLVPQLANVNAIGMVRFWNISYCLNILELLVITRFRHAGPKHIKQLISWVNKFTYLPGLLFLWALPAVSILIRLIQLKPNIDVYITHWDGAMIINFLAFLNNIRSIAVYNDPLQYFTKKVLSARMQAPFLDLVEVRPSDWYTLATLQYTSTPQELYRIFVGNQQHLYSRTGPPRGWHTIHNMGQQQSLATHIPLDKAQSEAMLCEEATSRMADYPPPIRVDYPPPTTPPLTSPPSTHNTVAHAVTVSHMEVC